MKAVVDWSGSRSTGESRPLYDLQFEDLSILERRPSSDVQSTTGELSLFTARLVNDAHRGCLFRIAYLQMCAFCYAPVILTLVL